MDFTFKPPPAHVLTKMDLLIMAFSKREAEAGRLGHVVSTHRMIGGVEHYFMALDRRTSMRDLTDAVQAMVADEEAGGRRPEDGGRTGFSTTKTRRKRTRPFVSLCLRGWAIMQRTLRRSKT